MFTGNASSIYSDLKPFEHKFLPENDSPPQHYKKYKQDDDNRRNTSSNDEEDAFLNDLTHDDSQSRGEDLYDREEEEESKDRNSRSQSRSTSPHPQKKPPPQSFAYDQNSISDAINGFQTYPIQQPRNVPKQTKKSEQGGNGDKTQKKVQEARVPPETVPLEEAFRTAYAKRMKNMIPAWENNNGDVIPPNKRSNEHDSVTSHNVQIIPDDDDESTYISHQSHKGEESKNQLRSKVNDVFPRTESSQSNPILPSSSQNQEMILDQHDEMNISPKAEDIRHPNINHRTMIAPDPTPPIMYNPLDECFLCSHGNRFVDSIEAPHVNKMFDIIHESFGISRNEDIALQVHLYFMGEVYRPNRGMPILTREMVFEHLEHHTLNARIYIGQHIKLWNRVFFLQMEKICLADGTLDLKQIKSAQETEKVINGLYRQKVNTLNFNAGDSTESMKRLGSYFVIQPMFGEKQAKNSIQERKESNVTLSSTSFSLD